MPQGLNDERLEGSAPTVVLTMPLHAAGGAWMHALLEKVDGGVQGRNQAMHSGDFGLDKGSALLQLAHVAG